MSTTAPSVTIGARVSPDVAAELRERADAQETTVSRIVGGIVRRALAGEYAPGRERSAPEFERRAA